MSSLDRARLLRLAGAAAAGLALPSVAEAAGNGFLKPHPRWRFVFVNHALANPFFIPARYGIQDACSLFDTDYSWTGSRRSSTRPTSTG